MRKTVIQKKCLQCLKLFNSLDKRNKFCNSSCAATYNNKKYPKRKKGYIAPIELARSIETKKRNNRIREEKRIKREQSFIRKDAEYPYDDYYLYINFHKKERRNYASLFNKNDRKKTYITSYARYLMSVKEKRILSKNEQVDHINEDRTDDRIENLQILTQSENIQKYIKKSKLTKKQVELECPNCKKIFAKRYGATHLCKGGSYTSCSRRCSGIISMSLYNGKQIDLSNNVIKIYNIKRNMSL